MYQRDDISLSPGVQLDVVHLEGVADSHSTLEPLSIITLCDDVDEGVQAYAEQQEGQSISLIDTALDVNLCNWLGIEFPMKALSVLLVLSLE